MRVLITHNRYQQAGGEDAVVAEESAMLIKHGVEVEHYQRDNAEIDAMSGLQVAMDTWWSRRTVAELATVIDRFMPDIIHSHNTFPLISASLYQVAARRRIPVVQTLHNFRLFCAQAMFMRNGKVCEDCLGKPPWRGALRACYRNSRAQSVVVVGMQSLHHALGTYRQQVTRYIALNAFCRDKFIEAGLPAERMAIKPNFVDLPATTDMGGSRAGGLFVGRLSTEKGLATLAGAAVCYPQMQIQVVGSGPQESMLAHTDQLQLLGWQPPQVIYGLMRKAAYLVMPSIWYENFPRALVEAYACGLPVIASRMGAMAALVDDRRTGLLFEPGKAEDLARTLQWADTHPDAMITMGHAARAEYEQHYTADINYETLMSIYRDAIAAYSRLAHAA